MLFTLLFTVWANDIGETYVADSGMSASDCTQAMVDYVTADPALSQGTPSCELAHDTRSAIFEHLGTDVILPACEFEDSTNCYWDAGSQGNGIGRSFYDINGVAYPFQP